MFKKISFLVLTALISNLNSELVLQKVLILSRHNVRTPLSKTLWQYSPKKWPVWNENAGHLTQKGVLLEGYMGEYFFHWLKKEGLFTNECPSEEIFYVYANTAQRTLASAKSFVSKAFPSCNITVNHAASIDPIFNPVIHNSSAIFLKKALEIMKKNIKELHLNKSLEMMDDILDYKDSDICVKNKLCDLVYDPNFATVKPGLKPNVNGPLKISKSSIDSFIMENYEGFNKEKVAWGLLDSNKKWQSIFEVSKSYHNIIFNSTIIAKDISKPLLHFISKILLKNTPKVALLMGHDANLYTLLNSMEFKAFNLREQFEITPVGGKIVFQKWSSNGEDYLKIDYVYQSTEGMREGVPLTIANPPLYEPLELKGCKVDQNGFCLWKDFEMLLQ